MSFWAYSLLYKPQRTEISIMESPSRLVFQRWNESLGSYGFGDFAATDSFFPMWNGLLSASWLAR